jgi:DNA mismatch repair protein MutL
VDLARRVLPLPDDLVNKIAAGEVVERPASVVKELVENALDAGARNVLVEIEGGGRGLIRVRDDGHGMAPEDAEAALQRHATSKLRALSDLEAIGTHGFRGEALPSIASVSHLSLKTRDDSGPAGTEIEVRHGRPVHVRAAGHPLGTTVEARDLFGEVPARRKFLRADSTETGHVAEAVTLLALAWPQVGFTLTSGGRRVIQAPPADGLPSRLFQLFGGPFVDDLAAVDDEGEGVRVYGFVARPDRPRSARPNLRLFVNGRPVRDRAIAKAVSEAYRAAGAGDYRGDACLFLDLPLHLVDVNVHPAKAEVRFAQPRAVWTMVERAVRHGLSAATRARAPRAEVAAPVEGAVERFLEHAADGASVRDDPPSARCWSAKPRPPLLRCSGMRRRPCWASTATRTWSPPTARTSCCSTSTRATSASASEAIQAQLRERRVESQLLLAPVVLTIARACGAAGAARGRAARAGVRPGGVRRRHAPPARAARGAARA